ncbi:Hypothetical protein Bdt_1247 [Bdellovibrio bacteriovorus str. Tiberius]|uniref:Uncharacterized protein n=1 Tax=Bdellovibrio bacteriovorus str. Tiberius TaxID=1069642 RepID=K7YMF6_BDEBC|nr:Hypothetical protein Bdt_1247 [Bdellovibrio bacteriovorus str. Tiberius]
MYVFKNANDLSHNLRADTITGNHCQFHHWGTFLVERFLLIKDAVFFQGLNVARAAGGRSFSSAHHQGR